MKNFIKLKKNFMLVLVVASPLLLGGAKYWQDPAALSDNQNCANGVCCAKCIETIGTAAPERMNGWQWKMQVASHYMR